MARAKRTDRAEARRRSRAAAWSGTVIDAEAGDGTAPTDPGPAAPTARARGAAATAPAPVRPGIGSAFRGSFRPLDLRGDLRALPQILTHWSLYVPIVLSGLSVALVPFMGAPSIATVLFGYFSGGAPFGTAFIAGLFAPRASYLVGAIAAAASAGFMALAFAVGPFGGTLEGAKDANGVVLTAQQLKGILLNDAITAGIPLAAIVASAGAWYRRFLNRANPNRARRPSNPTGRRPDGKVPRKPAQRPMLARRR